jgi:site-specific recombinase XerD
MRLKMSLQSRQELLLSLRPQYLGASSGEKKQLLNGLVAATGYNRKYAVTLLSKGISKKQGGKRKRKGKYNQAVVDALLIVWKAAYRICSKRLIPFMPILVESLIKHGHLDISEIVKAQLLSVSAATADRLLSPERRKLGKGISTTKPGYLIKQHIPIRTFADWNDVIPGFVEADLVAHCGENVRGKFLHTLTVTDIATGWTELGALMGKSEGDVLEEMAEMKELLPFPLLGFDSDNGGEFINYGLVDWCANNNITFTRSREYKKNDQAHVEEKNGAIVRRLIGYDRYEGVESWQLLSQLYRIARLYINFFQPCLKLISKWRDGARVHKRYDKAQTPYQRVLMSPSVTEESKEPLRKMFPKLDPMLLLQEMETLQIDLWKTAVGQQQSEQTESEQNQTSQPISVQPEIDGTNSEPAEGGSSAPFTAPTPAMRRRKRAKPESTKPALMQQAPDVATEPEQGAEIAVPNLAYEPGAPVTSLSTLIESFVNGHLRKQRLSENTILSYGDSLRLLHQFVQRYLSKDAAMVKLVDVNTSLVKAFLDDMEHRGISTSSRNLRLTVIHSFCRYVSSELTVVPSSVSAILKLRGEKYARPAIEFLTTIEIAALMAAPDRSTWSGRRDHAFLTIALETGLLVSELAKLTRKNVKRLEAGVHICVASKGRQQRFIPLTEQAAGVLDSWLQEPLRRTAQTLFPNARGGCLTDDGIRHILNMQIGAACESCPSLEEKRFTPFILRHTRAMQLLQSGMNREKIACWLGFNSVDSLQIYCNAHLALKKKAIKEGKKLS